MHKAGVEASGGLSAVKHRMTRRCDGWDYRARAIYQITLVQADRRRPVLGRLVIDDPSASAASEAVAAGRLLMLAPAAWPHVPGEKPMTRRDALVLNRLAQALAGDGAAEISYRGVTFAEVEAWARVAVKDPAGARRGEVV